MKTIAIIGGGISGLTVANSLQKNNIPFHLYESAPKFGEVGAALGIGANALEILTLLGLGEEIKRRGRYIENAIITDKRLKTIKEIPVKNVGFCIYRPTLIDVLSKNIDTQNVSFNKRLKNIETHAEKTTLTFHDNTTAAYDVIISCDGINSVIRKTVFPSIQKCYSGQTIWRGIAECDLPENYDKTYYEFWGGNLRFAIISMDKNKYYWYAVKWADAGEKDNPVTIKKDLQNLFNKHCAEINKVIENTSSIIRDDMYDLEPGTRPWHYKNIVFAGDSIHATTPNLAQGGCQAIEDAYTLGEVLGAFGINEGAFEKYTALRTEKANFVVRESRKLGKLSHQSNIVSEHFTKFLFRYFLPDSIFLNQYKTLTDLSYLQKIRPTAKEELPQSGNAV